MYLGASCPSLAGGYKHYRKQDLERIQKCACACASHIILGGSYTTYTDALEALRLESLEERRNTLAWKFALESEKHEKLKAWFKPASKEVNTRTKSLKYCEVRANHSRFYKSPLSFLTIILNLYYQGD